jgi:hypothetical protein
MKLAAIMLAFALTVMAPKPARAQMNPAQAAGLATSIAGIVFGALYPAPRCGPHDAPPHPYQPATPPHYAPPPGSPAEHADLDDDDDDEPIQPQFHRHLSTDASQPQSRPNADDESDQTTAVRTRDESQQPADEAAASDDEEQPAQTPMPHRARRRRPAQTIGQSQSSGQVAEIPSQPRVLQPPEQ